jgi:hypothetical protein
MDLWRFIAEQMMDRLPEMQQELGDVNAAAYVLM